MESQLLRTHLHQTIIALNPTSNLVNLVNMVSLVIFISESLCRNDRIVGRGSRRTNIRYSGSENSSMVSSNSSSIISNSNSCICLTNSSRSMTSRKIILFE